MRNIPISTDVFAALWSKRETGENNEDDILRRILDITLDPKENKPAATEPQGFVDESNGFAVPEGFQIFRVYKGRRFEAIASRGLWHLWQDNRLYGSLHKLSQAVVSGRENAWENWKFLDKAGQERKLTQLRDKEKIRRRNVVANANSNPSDNMSGHPASVAAQSTPDGHKKPGNILILEPDGTGLHDAAVAIDRHDRCARLNVIYEEVDKIRRELGKNITREHEAAIRRTLENHSSDSDNYNGGVDVFFMPEGKGAGVWALRESVEVLTGAKP